MERHVTTAMARVRKARKAMEIAMNSGDVLAIRQAHLTLRIAIFNLEAAWMRLERSWHIKS